MCGHEQIFKGSLCLQESRYSLEDISIGDITSGVVEARRIDQRYRQTSCLIKVYRSADVCRLGL